MPRTCARFVLPLLVVLALLPPGEAVAGPPEGVSGKMVLDEVGDGLRKYHKETDVRKRMNWLTKLAATHDIRVQVTLFDAVRDPNREVYWAAICLLGSHYLGATDPRTGRNPEERDRLFSKVAMKYRHMIEFDLVPDLRRRAAQLPR